MAESNSVLVVINKLAKQKHSAKDVLIAVLKVYSIPTTIKGFAEASSEYVAPYIERKHPSAATFNWLAENLAQISSHYLALRKPPEENEKGE